VTDEESKQAHRASIWHRDEILRSAACGCFYCLEVFEPGKIREWVDEGLTALCPACGIDSVIGTASGFPVDEGFLRQMQARWFASQ
jgi:hypothetical protein